MNKINLVMGDRSGDGHDKRDHLLIECNLAVDEINKAYTKGVKKTGFNLSNEVAAEYEDSKISNEHLQKLRELGFDAQLFDEEFMDKDCVGPSLDIKEFAHLFMFFVWLGNKDVVWEFVDNNVAEIDIGGYGLFS